MRRETILEETRAGVRTLAFNRPEARNAFDSRQWSGLADAIGAASRDDSVRVVIATGAPGAFTAGQDLGEMSAPPDAAAGGDHPFARCIESLIAFDKPLLAAVNGVGVGFGLTILLHCDIVYIATGARLRVPFVSLGVVPEAASSYLLPLAVGWQNAAEIFFTADWIDASRAVAVGLAARELAPDDLMPATRALAERIAQHPLGSLRHTKRLMQASRLAEIRAARAREDDGFRERVGSPENVEAIRAFFEKRKPDFSNLPPASTGRGAR